MAAKDQESQIAQVKQAIAALEGQRSMLGDAVVNSSIAALKVQLAELEGQSEPVEQRRKLVTILFTDVVGSTRIARQFDPEEVIDIMDATLRRLAEPVSRLGGHVTRFQGDGFKAVFGLPVAHENDPEMAIRAGLGILEISREIAIELKRKHEIEDFQVRVGINTGLVATGGRTEAEDTIMGETVNLAARLESAAPPGGLLITHETYRHVRGVFDVDPAEPVEAKGFPDPVQVYLVKSVKPRVFRLQTRGVEGIETRMIGRETELRILQEALFTTIEESEGQVVTVLGEAGVGKSRLLYEFQNWIELLPQGIWWFQGRARPETQNLPYALVRDLFAFRFQIRDEDPAELAREKFEQGIASALRADKTKIWFSQFNIVPEDQSQSDEITSWEHVAHLLGQLLGFDFSGSQHLKGYLEDPQALRHRAFESLAHYFSAVCQTGPVVIFLEDIHWADDSSLDAIRFLGQRSLNLSILIVSLARLSLLERRPFWGEGELYHRKIQLRLLTKVESRKLVDEILKKINKIPGILRELVVSGAEGNPYYIEELIKMLIDQEVIIKGEESWQVHPDRLIQLDVPSTLTGVLQARLDALSEEERSVLQQASVVGRVFWDRVIEYIQSKRGGDSKIVRQLLSNLRDRELIFRRENSQFSLANEYIFKHEMLREVAYESVLRKLRLQYHGWVGDWLIEQKSEGRVEYNGLIADHLELAGRGEMARIYLQKAGNVALDGYANAEAAHYFRRALDLAPYEMHRPDLLGGLADALQRQGFRDEAIVIWREGISLYQTREDFEGLACFYTAIIRSLLPNWPNEAVEQSQTGLSAVEGMGDSVALGHLLHQAARAYTFQGQAEKAGDLSQRALEIAEKVKDLYLHSDVLSTIGVLSFSWTDKAIQTLKQAIELAEASHSLYLIQRAHNNLAVAYTHVLSDYHSAIPHFLRALEINRQRGTKEEQAFILKNLVESYISLGNISAAEEMLRELEQIQLEMPQPELIAGKIQDSKGELARLRGELKESYILLSESLAEAQREGRIQAYYLIAVYYFIPVVLDLHRFEGWENWNKTERVLNVVIEKAGAVGGLVGEGETEAMLSAVYSRQDRIEEARLWLARAKEKSPGELQASAQSLLFIAETELAIAEERWEEAISKSDSLFNWYKRGVMHWDQAHALLNLAEIHRMRGLPEDQERAIELYGQSREIFEEIGAAGYVEIVDERLSLLQGQSIRPKE